MRIGVLCNSLLPLPAIQMLVSNGLIVSVGISAEENPETAEMVAFFSTMQLSVTKFHKNGLDDLLYRWLNKNKLDVVFVMTFPWKIPAKVLAQPKLGFFNFHYALLPKYRGASPVFWQLRNGETHGGLTIHRMDAGWDTGPLAHVSKIPIHPEETFGLHNKRVAWETVQGVAEFVQKLFLLGNAIPLLPQDETQAAYHKRPEADDITINWLTMTAVEAQRLVNACNPWNKGAYSFFNQNVFKIIQVAVKEQAVVYNQKLIPGTVVGCSEKKTIDIITVDNRVVEIEVVYTEIGYHTADFLLQLGLRTGMTLSSSL